MYYLKYLILLSVTCLLMGSNIYAQQKPDPKQAFLRSLLIPGWGHRYANHENWRRGQVHLGSEIVLIATYFGLSARAENIENNYETLAALEAGVNIRDRSRTFRLAIGDFQSLEEYNNFQRRSRNWNRIFDDLPQNRWYWKDEKARNYYNKLRSDVDGVRNQLPAILSLMVVNRLVSALSAYNRAKHQSEMPDISVFPVKTGQSDIGVIGKLNFRF